MEIKKEQLTIQEAAPYIGSCEVEYGLGHHDILTIDLLAEFQKYNTSFHMIKSK